VIASLPLLPDPRVSQADICQIAIIVGWVGQCRSRISFFFFCQTSASKTRIWTTSCVQYIREQIHFLCVRVSPILFHVVSFGLSAIRNETKPTPRCWHEWKHASCSSFLRNNKSKVVFFFAESRRVFQSRQPAAKPGQPERGPAALRAAALHDKAGRHQVRRIPVPVEDFTCQKRCMIATDSWTLCFGNRVGKKGGDCDIQLNGALVADFHCSITNKNEVVSLTPVADAAVFVNGDLIDAAVVLRHVSASSDFALRAKMFAKRWNESGRKVYVKRRSQDGPDFFNFRLESTFISLIMRVICKLSAKQFYLSFVLIKLKGKCNRDIVR